MEEMKRAIELDLLKYSYTIVISFILLVALSLCIGILINKWIQTATGILPPGPKGLPFFGYLPFLGKEPHITLTELGKKYGSIYGLHLGRNYTVIITDYKLAKETLSHPLAMGRSSEIFGIIPCGAGIASMNGEEWKEQRRFCLHTMRDLGMGKGPWESLIQEEVLEFADVLYAQKGKPFDISDEISSSLCCNIMSLLIGRKMKKNLEKDNVEVITDFLEICLKYTTESSATTSFPWLRKLLEIFKISGHHETASIISKFLSFLRNEIKSHQELADTKDFIDLYQNQRAKLMDRENHSFSARNLEGNLSALLLGAGDTISSSMKWIFCLMAKYPEIQDKVYAELNDIIGSEGNPSYENRNKFIYTFAVMMEAQRYSTIVPLNTTRCALDDFTIKGYTIPKGAHIVVVTWALHFDPNYWEHPEKFDPDRFLSDDKKRLLKLDSFIPFSIGKRNCPGETVGWMEIFLYFTTIIRRFKVTIPEGGHLNFDIDYGLVSHLKPQKLCFVPRD